MVGFVGELVMTDIAPSTMPLTGSSTVMNDAAANFPNKINKPKMMKGTISRSNRFATKRPGLWKNFTCDAVMKNTKPLRYMNNGI